MRASECILDRRYVDLDRHRNQETTGLSDAPPNRHLLTFPSHMLISCIETPHLIEAYFSITLEASAYKIDDPNGTRYSDRLLVIFSFGQLQHPTNII